MQLNKHTLFKGDSLNFIIKTDIPDLSIFDTIKVYINDQTKNIEDSPFAILTGSGILTINKDDGAEINVYISPNLSSTFEKNTYYYIAKGSNSSIRKTLGIGIIALETFFGDYYLARFRKFLKDEKEKNKGEFLNTIENSDDNLKMYLLQAVEAFNASFFKTNFTIDDFPGENLLFIGALLQALISNGILNARCALTYQDAGGIVIQDMDRWGRYAQLFSQYYNVWKQQTLEIKRSWNIENSFDEIPSILRFGGFDYTRINYIPYYDDIF